MTSALLVVVIFLAILTFGNLLLLFAVIRRLRHVQELAMPQIPVPAVGTIVEPFAVDLISGANVAVNDMSDGPVLVAYLSNTCPACKTMAGELAALAQPAPPPVVMIVGGAEHDSSELLEALAGLDQVAMISMEHPAVTAFGQIEAFPTVLAVSAGKVISSGTTLDKVLPALGGDRKVAAR